MLTMVEIKEEDGYYCGYYLGKPITKQGSLMKAMKKMTSYVRGLS